MAKHRDEIEEPKADIEPAGEAGQKVRKITKPAKTRGMVTK